MEGNSSHASTSDASAVTASTLEPHIVSFRIRPNKASFFDLPAEIGTLIYEHYCSSIAPQPILPQSPWLNRRNTGSLKPQLLCHRFRDEFLAAWTNVATIALPIYQSPFYYGPNHTTRVSKCIDLQPLYILIRDWFDRVPSDLRHRIRRIRLTYAVEICYLEPYLEEVTDTQHSSEGRAVAGLMERLFDVHPLLRVDLRIMYGWGSCSTHGYCRYRKAIEFRLSQRDAGLVRKIGDYE